MEVAEKGAVPAGEREPGHRGGDDDVDADHASREATDEFTGRPTAPREERGSVAVEGLHAAVEGGFERVHADHGEDRAENLLAADPHLPRHMIDNRRTEKEAWR